MYQYTIMLSTCVKPHVKSLEQLIREYFLSLGLHYIYTFQTHINSLQSCAVFHNKFWIFILNPLDCFVKRLVHHLTWKRTCKLSTAAVWHPMLTNLPWDSYSYSGTNWTVTYRRPVTFWTLWPTKSSKLAGGSRVSTDKETCPHSQYWRLVYRFWRVWDVSTTTTLQSRPTKWLMLVAWYKCSALFINTGSRQTVVVSGVRTTLTTSGKYAF